MRNTPSTALGLPSSMSAWQCFVQALNTLMSQHCPGSSPMPNHVIFLTLRSMSARAFEYWLGWSPAAVQSLCCKGLHLRLRADPARRGLSAAVVRWLLACGARTIVYVSCHLATQVRRMALSTLSLPEVGGHLWADYALGCLAAALAGLCDCHSAGFSGIALCQYSCS